MGRPNAWDALPGRGGRSPGRAGCAAQARWLAEKTRVVEELAAPPGSREVRTEEIVTPTSK